MGHNDHFFGNLNIAYSVNTVCPMLGLSTAPEYEKYLFLPTSYLIEMQIFMKTICKYE